MIALFWFILTSALAKRARSTVLCLISKGLIFISAQISLRWSLIIPIRIIPKCIYLSVLFFNNLCFVSGDTKSKYTIFPIELIVCWFKNLVILEF